MQPPLHQRDAAPVEIADDQLAGVARRGGDRETGDLAIGDRRGARGLVGELAEARAEDDRGVDRLVDPVGDGGDGPPPARSDWDMVTRCSPRCAG
jgi:hypothetical protein